MFNESICYVKKNALCFGLVYNSNNLSLNQHFQLAESSKDLSEVVIDTTLIKKSYH